MNALIQSMCIENNLFSLLCTSSHVTYIAWWTHADISFNPFRRKCYNGLIFKILLNRKLAETILPLGPGRWRGGPPGHQLCGPPVFHQAELQGKQDITYVRECWSR